MIRLDHDQIARLAHEAFRQACLLMYDSPPAPWADAAQGYRSAALDIVTQLVDNPSPSYTARVSHEDWRAAQVAAGWSFGTYRDATNKRSPLILTWEELSPKYRTKRSLMFATVRHLLHPEAESA